MRKVTLFYAWQSDIDSKLCRSFIRTALEGAAKTISADPSLDAELVIDSGTEGIGGNPPVTEVILEKIRACDIFAPDLTFIATTRRRKQIPNPNVLLEYGYAIAKLAKGNRGTMSFMNTAFGPPSKLPFDLGYLRHPITYNAPKDIGDQDRERECARLTKVVEAALRVMVSELVPERRAESEFDEDGIAQAQTIRDQALSNQHAGYRPVLVRSPKIILHLIPASALAPGRTVDADLAEQLLLQLTPDFLGGRDSRPDSTGWWVAATPIPQQGLPNPMSRWCTRLFENGVLEYVQNIGERADPNAVLEIKGLEVEHLIVSILDRIAEPFSKLSPGPVILFPTLCEVSNVFLAKSRPHPTSGFQNAFEILPHLIFENGIASPVGRLLKPVFDRIWRIAGWTGGSQSFQTGDWAGYTNRSLYSS